MSSTLDSLGEILGTSGAARGLGVSEQTVRNMVFAGKLPATRWNHGRWMFLQSDIDKLKREREAKAAR